MRVQVSVQTHVTSVLFTKRFHKIIRWEPERSYGWEAFHSETLKTSRASQIKPNVKSCVVPKGSLKKKIPNSKVMEGLMY